MDLQLWWPAGSWAGLVGFQAETYPSGRTDLRSFFKFLGVSVHTQHPSWLRPCKYPVSVLRRGPWGTAGGGGARAPN